MSNLPAINRRLSNYETKAIQMLDLFDTLVEKNKLFGEFTLNGETFRSVEALRIATPQRVETDRPNDRYYVRYSMPELHKYVLFLCGHAGLDLDMDGSVRTRDGFKIDRANSTLNNTKGHSNYEN